MFFISHRRRAFLRASGVSIALPLLESVGRGQATSEATETPRRMVCVGNEFGMFPGAFWPAETGRDYALTSLLQPLAAHRDNFTLFSHLDHGLKGG
ncbi:MAG: DUF1552 domain-containing protein, partial [Planctomycetaceae bacterium]|nr:DUF1552 domain-containing protein [Planctomycetaceae bacterium]